jgi:hypothetical protein
MKSYWIKVVETREAYVPLQAENETQAREDVFEMDPEAFDWESHGIEIESVDEEEPDNDPSL